ncbi:ABC transporter substrate-binding protein [Bacillus horti]|uniref:NitT/TauT family transport system substrate-binding protein n=1 Tax=Caldalkalibacillus horti TaxID=77523 RepID=A0ABT9VWM0_9BACI|nr:ABC transporter substrate-binding protein [Bacillus horti]MDQ0165396.1 NitT/TauT family transport system substrate-binding protein [Bacillus horti]
MGWLRIILCVVLVLTMVSLAACSSSTNGLEQVRVAEVTRSIFYAPLYVAVTKGFFEEQGLEVEITTAWGGDKTMTTLISDGADIALVGSETSIYVYQQGTDDPIINFAQLTQTDGTFLVAREEHDSFSWDQLNDSVFLGQRVGGMPQMVGEYVLKQHGIDPQADLELIQNIDFSNIPNAFASGTGEYVQLFEPQATLFEKEGIGHIVASFGAESGQIPYTVFMSKQSYINDNADTIQRFTNAIYKAQQYVYATPTEEIAEAILPFFEDTDLDIVISVINRYAEQESYAPTPILQEESWLLLQEIIDQAGELEQIVEYDTLVETRFAEQAINQ